MTTFVLTGAELKSRHALVAMQMLEGPQIMGGLGMTHALGLTSCILCLVDLCHDAHTDLVGKHTCLGTRLSHRHTRDSKA